MPLSLENQPSEAVVVDGPSLGIERRLRGSGGRGSQRQPGIRNRGVVVVDARRMLGLLQRECLGVSRLSLHQAGRDRMQPGAETAVAGVATGSEGPRVTVADPVPQPPGWPAGTQPALLLRYRQPYPFNPACPLEQRLRSCSERKTALTEAVSAKESRESVKYGTAPRKSTSSSPCAWPGIFPAGVWTVVVRGPGLTIATSLTPWETLSGVSCREEQEKGS